VQRKLDSLLTELPASRGLVRLRPFADTFHITQDRAVLSTALDGFIPQDSHHGLFINQTRMLCRLECLLGGRPLHLVALSNVEQHSWLGYYVALPPEIDPAPTDQGSGLMEKLSEHSLEVRISRTIGGGLHEDWDITNYTQQMASFDLEIMLDADFADPVELHSGRHQHGQLQREWRPDTGEGAALDFDYRASHHYEHQGESGDRSIHRGLTVRFVGDSSPQHVEGKVTFRIQLPPLASWHACVLHMPRIDGREMPPAYGCRAFASFDNRYENSRRTFFEHSTRFSVPQQATLAAVVGRSLERARHDLAALRLFDYDHPPHGWLMAAGSPLYIALFGRDSLTSAWQAALASSNMMYGAAAELARWQGTEDNPWRDEQPGKMLHEAHVGPLESLGFNPRDRYYGAVTTSSFYPVVVSELWHWTGSKDLIYPLLGPAMKALESVDRYGDLDGDGFIDYRSRSEQGNPHQGWKDSAGAVVYPDGSPVEPPIATCEEQGFAYAARLQFAEVLWWMDKKEEARRLLRQAEELKERFNRHFWMPEHDFLAFALDSRQQQVQSIVSNAGHCVAAGIVDTHLVAKVADRLFAPDMFSGWGIRTLSSDNPAYNPYSYHRGSIWPVEHGAFAIGFMRYGLIEPLHRVARSMFEAASLFDHYRLPEVFSGHARDHEHPFPALYPKTNWPQAWSSSALFSILQALLGLYPYAPLNLLIVDPQLPEWLPGIALTDLRVGAATVTLNFFRRPDGRSDYEVLDQRGSLHIVRQPSPWSLTAGFGERLRDLVSSLAPSR
jgi:glycogen debranching enzyme